MLKKHLRSEASKLFLKRLMLALSVALVITFLLLIKNIHSVSRDGILHKRQVASAALDLSYIDYWMTFEYLNTVFKLPDSYLQQQLNITNSRYPRLSIARYASSHKIKRATAITQVKQLISNYLATQQQ
ncbi:MAG TPA: hypothetical protein PLJ58_01380 [bacterium]|nr:hypothetical protein [bacterium]